MPLSRRLGLCAGLVLALAAGILFGRLSMMGARSKEGLFAADMGGWQSEGLAVAAVVVVALILMAGRGFEAISGVDRRESSNVQPADLSRLGHELRTPLNAIIGFSEVMQMRLLGPIGHPRYEEYVRHISDNGHELKRGIERVLADAEAVARQSHFRVH
jgi:signal transduction histidine kinase